MAAFDANLVKEAKQAHYIRTVLPLLFQNTVVHILGYGNRLGFDPLPSELQRLRGKIANATFMPKIQRVGTLLVRRIRNCDAAPSMLDKQLLGSFMHSIHFKLHDPAARGPFKYLALRTLEI